jgi:hypothetical protein
MREFGGCKILPVLHFLRGDMGSCVITSVTAVNTLPTEVFESNTCVVTSSACVIASDTAVNASPTVVNTSDTGVFNLNTHVFTLVTYVFNLITHVFSIIAYVNTLITSVFALFTYVFTIFTYVFATKPTAFCVFFNNWGNRTGAILTGINKTTLNIQKSCINAYNTVYLYTNIILEYLLTGSLTKNFIRL